MEGESVNKIMSMGCYLVNTVEYNGIRNGMRKRSRRWECQEILAKEWKWKWRVSAE